MFSFGISLMFYPWRTDYHSEVDTNTILPTVKYGLFICLHFFADKSFNHTAYLCFYHFLRQRKNLLNISPITQFCLQTPPQTSPASLPLPTPLPLLRVLLLTTTLTKTNTGMFNILC